MAAKTKSKLKQRAKPIKKVAVKAASGRKSVVSKAKTSKVDHRKPAKAHAKPAPRPVRKPAPKVEVRDTVKPRNVHSRDVAVQKIRSREYSSAIHAYEAGLKLMHAEEYEKAIRAFKELIAQHSDEPEIQERARVLIHASEKRLHEKARTVLRSADDHYNIAIAELNRRQLDAAAQHLQHALKLAPKGDHILYAMAAVNALKGNRDEALTFLKQSIHHRPENRFMALRDSDFESLLDDADFKQLVAGSEK
jgi:tetratricopeptide (TPR) repeat protein